MCSPTQFNGASASTHGQTVVPNNRTPIDCSLSTSDQDRVRHFFQETRSVTHPVPFTINLFKLLQQLQLYLSSSECRLTTGAHFLVGKEAWKNVFERQLELKWDRCSELPLWSFCTQDPQFYEIHFFYPAAAQMNYREALVERIPFYIAMQNCQAYIEDPEEELRLLGTYESIYDLELLHRKLSRSLPFSRFANALISEFPIGPNTSLRLIFCSTPFELKDGLKLHCQPSGLLDVQFVLCQNSVLNTLYQQFRVENKNLADQPSPEPTISSLSALPTCQSSKLEHSNQEADDQYLVKLPAILSSASEQGTLTDVLEKLNSLFQSSPLADVVKAIHQRCQAEENVFLACVEELIILNRSPLSEEAWKMIPKDEMIMALTRLCTRFNAQTMPKALTKVQCLCSTKSKVSSENCVRLIALYLNQLIQDPAHKHLLETQGPFLLDRIGPLLERHTKLHPLVLAHPAVVRYIATSDKYKSLENLLMQQLDAELADMQSFFTAHPQITSEAELAFGQIVHRLQNLLRHGAALVVAKIAFDPVFHSMGEILCQRRDFSTLHSLLSSIPPKTGNTAYAQWLDRCLEGLMETNAPLGAKMVCFQTAAAYRWISTGTLKKLLHHLRDSSPASPATVVCFTAEQLTERLQGMKGQEKRAELPTFAAVMQVLKQYPDREPLGNKCRTLIESYKGDPRCAVEVVSLYVTLEARVPSLYKGEWSKFVKRLSQEQSDRLASMVATLMTNARAAGTTPEVVNFFPSSEWLLKLLRTPQTRAVYLRLSLDLSSKKPSSSNLLDLGQELLQHSSPEMDSDFCTLVKKLQLSEINTLKHVWFIVLTQIAARSPDVDLKQLLQALDSTMAIHLGNVEDKVTFWLSQNDQQCIQSLTGLLRTEIDSCWVSQEPCTPRLLMLESVRAHQKLNVRVGNPLNHIQTVQTIRYYILLASETNPLLSYVGMKLLFQILAQGYDAQEPLQALFFENYCRRPFVFEQPRAQLTIYMQLFNYLPLLQYAVEWNDDIQSVLTQIARWMPTLLAYAANDREAQGIIQDLESLLINLMRWPVLIERHPLVYHEIIVAIVNSLMHKRISVILTPLVQRMLLRILSLGTTCETMPARAKLVETSKSLLSEVMRGPGLEEIPSDEWSNLIKNLSHQTFLQLYGQLISTKPWNYRVIFEFILFAPVIPEDVCATLLNIDKSLVDYSEVDLRTALTLQLLQIHVHTRVIRGIGDPIQASVVESFCGIREYLIRSLVQRCLALIDDEESYADFAWILEDLCSSDPTVAREVKALLNISDDLPSDIILKLSQLKHSQH